MIAEPQPVGKSVRPIPLDVLKRVFGYVTSRGDASTAVLRGSRMMRLRGGGTVGDTSAPRVEAWSHSGC